MNYLGHNHWDGLKYHEFYEKVITGKYDKIIIFGQNEWEWHNHDSVHWPKVKEHCKNTGTPLHVITAAHKHLYPAKANDLIVDWWDTYWIGKTYQSMVHHNNDKFIDPHEVREFKYRFISMNYRPHAHRLLLIDLLAKHDLIKDNAISCYQNSELFKWKYFQFRPLILEPDFPLTRDQEKLPIQYYESFAQLISESTSTAIILSEKTAIPLLVGKPFLVSGQMHYHRFLKSLGFEWYTEIFDYTFDDEPDEYKRYEMLLSNYIELQAVSIKNLPELHKKIADKIKYNQRRALEIAYDLNLYPKIALEVIEHFKRTGVAIDQRLIDVHITLESYRGRHYKNG